jgi:hypothetical protein
MTCAESTGGGEPVDEKHTADYREVRKRALELADEEEARKQKAVREALAKFNFMIHVTGYISGCSFLVIMGILLPAAMPYVFIPIGLWSVGLTCHGYRAFGPRDDEGEAPKCGPGGKIRRFFRRRAR